MKTLIIALAATLAGSVASADGFVCATEAQDLKVQVYNHVQPEHGTRNAAKMVLSNPQLALGRKTIAAFSSASLLDNHATVYTADVDLRFSESSRKGELIAGTKLGFIDTITLAVDFSYTRPMIEGATTEGILTIVKRNGDVKEVAVECERYLKN